MLEFSILIFSAFLLTVPLIVFLRVYQMTHDLKEKGKWLLFWFLTFAFFVSYVLLALSFVTDLEVYRNFLLIVVLFSGAIFITAVAWVARAMIDTLNRLLAKRTKAKTKKQRELVALKDQFIFVAAHELRSPVTAIKWNLELFREHVDSKSYTREEMELLESIEDSNEYLVELVNDLLDVSRIEAGTFNIKARPLEVESLIFEVTQLLAFQADQKGIKLKYKKGKKAAPAVMADPRRLKEVLVNLLSNAIKYSPKDSTVEIFLEDSDPFLKLHFKDKGVGFSKQDEKMLFKKFSRIKNARTEKRSGTGLGLYICKRIVQKMGGEIWAESPGQGKGAVFSFTLPVTKKIPMNS